MDMSLQASHTGEWQRPVNRVLQRSTHQSLEKTEFVILCHGFDTLSS